MHLGFDFHKIKAMPDVVMDDLAKDSDYVNGSIQAKGIKMLAKHEKERHQNTGCSKNLAIIRWARLRKFFFLDQTYMSTARSQRELTQGFFAFVPFSDS